MFSATIVIDWLERVWNGRRNFREFGDASFGILANFETTSGTRDLASDCGLQRETTNALGQISTVRVGRFFLDRR